MANTNAFDALDYSLFGLTLALSAAVGIYFGFRKKQQSVNDTEAELLVGGHNLPIIPTALSLLTSFISGISLLGVPAELYLRGVNLWWNRFLGTMTALTIVSWFVLPIFYRLQLISIYEYLELRYNSRLIRYIGAAQYLFICTFYVGVVLYGPANALSGVTDIPAWIFVISVGIVCIIYTSIGGIRAVVWTDTLQAVFMFIGCITILVKGTLLAGGFEHTIKTAAELGRFEGFRSLIPNPFQYHSFFLMSLGGIYFWTSLLGFNQISLQRYLCLPSLKSARNMALMNIPFYAITVTLIDFIGLSMLAYYLGCDPWASRKVDNLDQLVIYFGVDVLGDLPGFLGIFLACLFSGTLSTVSRNTKRTIGKIMSNFWDRVVEELPSQQ